LSTAFDEQLSKAFHGGKRRDFEGLKPKKYTEEECMRAEDK
jgi:hypothetical protein